MEQQKTAKQCQSQTRKISTQFSIKLNICERKKTETKKMTLLLYTEGVASIQLASCPTSVKQCGIHKKHYIHLLKALKSGIHKKHLTVLLNQTHFPGETTIQKKQNKLFYIQVLLSCMYLFLRLRQCQSAALSSYLLVPQDFGANWKIIQFQVINQFYGLD